MNIETLRVFFGWCTIINTALIIVALAKILTIRDWASKIHAKMFRVDEEALRLSYFNYFVYYKIAFVVFNLAPYLALSIMSWNQ